MVKRRWIQKRPFPLGGRSWKFSRKQSSWPSTKQKSKQTWSSIFGTGVRYGRLIFFFAFFRCFNLIMYSDDHYRIALKHLNHCNKLGFHLPAGGRFLVLGMFLGLICTIVCATYAVNVFVLFWFTVTSDQSKVPIEWRDKLYQFGWDMNWASNFIGYFFVFFSWYVCV